MNCEICGRRTESPVKIRLEGATMNVCDNCSNMGERVRVPPVFMPKPKKELQLSVEEIVQDYYSIVKSARERKGWTQEELAHKILEKEFIIHRIEQGRMMPTIPIARKLQKALDIQLITMSKEEAVDVESTQSSRYTLGDMIKVKKK